jgi:superfamily II DNA or RNA helicase
MQLRDYQLNCLDFLSQFKGPRLCVGSPTGSGKTVIFSHFAGLQLNEGKKTLILVHRKELLEQTRKVFIEQFNHHPALIKAGQKAVYSDNQSIYLGMVETVFRRPQLLAELRANIDTLIIDECHLQNFLKLIDGFRQVIGFSATPQIVKKGDCLKNYYKHLYEVTAIDELVEDGYLIKPITYVPAGLAEKVKSMRLSVSMGDYREADQEREINKIYSDVIDSIKRFKSGRTIIFHPSIALSKKVSETLSGLGFESYHLDGETPDTERDFIKSRLESGPEVIVNNVNVLTTGFDERKIETIVLNRLTKSENLLIQMVGRGARLAPEIDKKNFILLDLYGNCLRLGTWEKPRDWQARFSKVVESKDGEAPVKLCPACEAVVPAPSKVCPHCGHEFLEEKKEASLKERPGLVILTEDTIKEKMKDLSELIKTRSFSIYYGLHKLVEHVLKHSKNKQPDEIELELMTGLRAWVDEARASGKKKKFDQWHKDFVLKIYKEKQAARAT